MASTVVQGDMKIDGRTLTRETLEGMRFMALDRMAEGESLAAISASFGMHRAWAYKVRLKARGQGKRAVQLRKAPGRRRTLTDAQARQVFRWVNGKNPRQYGFDFGLWTRQIVRELIAQRFDVTLSLASVGALLARVGLTPQKPLQRADQRDPEAITRWQRETDPAIARQARRGGADIAFWDESGFRADAVHGKTWGARGQTPVVEVPGQRQGIRAASAVSAKGAFWFTIYRGGLNGDWFMTLLRRLMRGQRRPLHLILDNLPAHKTRAVKAYVASRRGKLTLHFLPSYAPELNPDELVWSHAKRTGNARRPLRAGECLEDRIPLQLAHMAAQPDLIRSFFRHPSVAYIADC